MSRDSSFEFGFISRKEKIKLAGAKLLCLAIVAFSLLALVFSDYGDSLASRFAFAGGALSAFAAYMNLFKVKSELVELFEPPYDFDGTGIAVLIVLFVLASYVSRFF